MLKKVFNVKKLNKNLKINGKILTIFMTELIFLHIKVFCKTIKKYKPFNGNMGQDNKLEIQKRKITEYNLLGKNV